MNRTVSPYEQTVATNIRILLRDLRPGSDAPYPGNEGDLSSDGHGHPYLNVQSALEYFIQEVIREIEHCATLDGLIACRVRKLAPLEADVVGVCWYIKQQRLAPFYTHFRVAGHADCLEWCYCCLGALGPQGEITSPASSTPTNVGHKVAHRIHQIRWKHCVEYGERGPTVPVPGYS